MALRLKWTASVVVVLVFTDLTHGMKRIFSKSKSSQETSVSQPWNIHSFQRGRFKRVQRPEESPEGLNRSDTAVSTRAYAEISREIKCNDEYHMLSYLHLAIPRNAWYPIDVETLHRKMNAKYPEWARKMLMTAFNVANSDNETDVQWLLYLYVKRIEVHVSAAKDPENTFLPIMLIAHYGMYKVVLCTMFENECTMFDPKTKKERKFIEYVTDMIRSRRPFDEFKVSRHAVLKLLEKHWPDLSWNSSLGCCRNGESTSAPVPDVQPLTEEHFTLDRLYLNYVFENVRATTLLTDFGVFQDGYRLLGYLENRIAEFKSVSTQFHHYVLSLVDFHEHVQRAFETMMLRIFYDFLDNLEKLNKDLRQEHVERFLRPYYEWCDFLYLPRHYYGFYASQLQQSWESDDNISETTFHALQEWVIEKLTVNDKTSKVSLDNHTADSLKEINIEKIRILDTADEYEIPVDPRLRASDELIQTTILCAEVLVGYMKNIFVNINFRAIRSLVKLRTSTNFQRFQVYGQQYRPSVFYREYSMRSIDVCSTQQVLVH